MDRGRPIARGLALRRREQGVGCPQWCRSLFGIGLAVFEVNEASGNEDRVGAW